MTVLFLRHTLLSPSSGNLPYRNAAPGARFLLGLPVKREGRREGAGLTEVSELGQATDSEI